MENNFAQLIRKSPFVSLWKGQVLKSETANFGLKYPVKEKKSIVYNQMSYDYKSGLQKISEVERFKELFAVEDQVESQNLKQSYHLGEVNKKALESLTPQEWYALIRKTRALRPEFQLQLAQNKTNEMGWKEFIGIDSLQKKKLKSYPIIYTQKKDEELKVQGRVLRALNGKTLIIGVQGFACTLDSIEIPVGYQELNKCLYQGHRHHLVDREKEYTFTVISASHDKNGNPQIQLSLKPIGKRAKVSTGGLYLKGVHLDADRGQAAKHELEKLILGFNKAKRF